MEPVTAGTTLTRFAELIDTRDWEGLRSVLAPGFLARQADSGRRLDADEWVVFNREYPGDWAFRPEDLVDSGTRGVLLARVTDRSEPPAATYVVAVFATIDEEGLLTRIEEVWAEVQPAASGADSLLAWPP